MALPQTQEGHLIVVYVGDGASPEVFTPICGSNGSSLNRTARTNDNFVRDCADPTLLPQRQVSVTGEQFDLTVQGYLNTAETAIELLDEVFGIRRTWRREFLDEAGAPIGHWQGPGKLISNTDTGPEEGKATAELTVASDGRWTYTPAP